MDSVSSRHSEDPGKPVDGQDVRDAVDDAVIPQLRTGKVDGDVDVLHLRRVSTPRRELTHGFLHHPVADLRDHPAVFGERYELSRGEHTPSGVRPADERFHAHARPAGQADDRLVHEMELALRDGTAQIALQLHPLRHFIAHRLVEDGHLVPTGLPWPGTWRCPRRGRALPRWHGDHHPTAKASPTLAEM